MPDSVVLLRLFQITREQTPRLAIVPQDRAVAQEKNPDALVYYNGHLVTLGQLQVVPGGGPIHFLKELPAIQQGWIEDGVATKGFLVVLRSGETLTKNETDGDLPDNIDAKSIEGVGAVAGTMVYGSIAPGVKKATIKDDDYLFVDGFGFITGLDLPLEKKYRTKRVWRLKEKQYKVATIF
jgi:hypothetical protein